MNNFIVYFCKKFDNFIIENLILASKELKMINTKLELLIGQQIKKINKK